MPAGDAAFSDNVKNLIEGMLALDPNQRLTID